MKQIISTENAPKAIGPYSQAVSANGFIFLSGQIPLDPATGKFVEGGVKEQAHQVCKNILAILEAAGSSVDKVVKTTCFLSDMANFAEMNEVYSQYFTANCPARSTIAVKQLPMSALVEIETVALA